MKAYGQQKVFLVSVKITEHLSLNAQEAGFLRKMARHCVDTRMGGFGACEELIKALDEAHIPEITPGPIYDLFKPE